MRNSRPIVQILIITLITLVLSLLGMVLLIGEVRQEILRMVSATIVLPGALKIPPIVWRVLLGVVIAAIIYLLVRLGVSYSIPRLRKAHKCPLCGNRLQRVHRQKPERILSTLLLLRIGRYGCMNCEWSGLRRYHKHPEV